MNKKTFSGNKTIIYYSSNRENFEFEQKIIEDLLSKSGGLPIISVTQKPIKLGYNICVGEVGCSYVNEWRQILIGAKQAKTEYLIMAESDFLYPPEYFKFDPKGRNIYRYDSVWVMWLGRKYRYFHKKYYSEGAQLVKRRYFIKQLENYLKKLPEWSTDHFRKYTWNTTPYSNQPYTFFKGSNPCVTFKTGLGASNAAGCLRGPENTSTTLPYWGSINDLKNKYL